jgi:hypothetical protein
LSLTSAKERQAEFLDGDFSICLGVETLEQFLDLRIVECSILEIGKEQVEFFKAYSSTMVSVQNFNPLHDESSQGIFFNKLTTNILFENGSKCSSLAVSCIFHFYSSRSYHFITNFAISMNGLMELNRMFL